MNDGDQWYFAYGSNLLPEQMEGRTGRICEALRCRLPGFRLAFNKRGSSRSPVFANIVPSADDEVWGVAYRCRATAFDQLDDAEGVARGHYKHEAVHVETDDGTVLKATAYIAGDGYVCAEGQPSDDYLNRILSGALRHHLPALYVDLIRRLARPT